MKVLYLSLTGLIIYMIREHKPIKATYDKSQVCVLPRALFAPLLLPCSLRTVHDHVLFVRRAASSSKPQEKRRKQPASRPRRLVRDKLRSNKTHQSAVCSSSGSTLGQRRSLSQCLPKTKVVRSPFALPPRFGEVFSFVTVKPLECGVHMCDNFVVHATSRSSERDRVLLRYRELRSCACAPRTCDPLVVEIDCLDVAAHLS